LFVADFLPPCLHGEIRLCRGNFSLRRISIHGNQITTISAEKIILTFQLCPFPSRHHLPGFKKMIIRVHAGRFGRHPSFLNHALEILPFGVGQRRLKLASEPVLCTALPSVPDSI